MPDTPAHGPDRLRKEIPIEKAVIRELVIEDVDPAETDDELWHWAMTTVFLPHGVEVAPWTRRTLQRHPETQSATISLFIEFEQGDEERRPVN
jgi:hypothetical protein